MTAMGVAADTRRAGTGTRSSGTGRWSVLALLCLSLLLIAVDATVLHIAGPALTAALDPSSVQMLWIVDGYSLVVAPLLLTFGTLGDRHGRRRLVLTGYVVFGAASAAAAFAPTATALIAARMLLGVGGAMIMPATLSIIRQVFTDRRERAIALGVWSAVAAAGAAAGPLLGGLLVERFWWGAVFLINVPILLVLLPAAARILPESRTRAGQPWDAPSALLSVLGILAFAFGLKEAGAGRPEGVAAFLGGVALLAWFVRRQRRLAVPLLDLSLFRRRSFSTGVAAVLLTVFSLVGLQLMLAQYLQLVLGDSPPGAAVRMLPLMAASVAGGLAGAHLLRRLGLRATMGGGLALTALSLAPTLAWGTEEHPLALALCFVGIGFGIQVALLAASDTIMSSASESHAGGAAAIEETAYELGAGLGVAVLGTVTTAVYAPSLAPVEGVSAELMERARQSLAAADAVARELGGQGGAALLAQARLAFVSGLHSTIVVSVLLLGATAAAVAVLVPRGSDDRTGPD
ncbi:transporter [Planomonospora sphaerica]|uniref:Transporter n=1 Tax=Planomonospora sphaerica TaxID=161355 RepID=A0A171DG42_9ACTN|nr:MULTISPECIES: MFS transporter [Planomonospora]GAT68309.1 transporter [Planomonospora sphaerica]